MSNQSDILTTPVNLPSEIPDNWTWFKLSDKCKPKQWRTISQSDLTKTGYPVFGANGFIGYFKDYNHEFETIAITCRGATCGTVNLVPEKAYITGNSMCLDDLHNSLDQSFLYYALSYRGLSDAVSGTAQPQITGDSLKFITYPSPPLPHPFSF